VLPAALEACREIVDGDERAGCHPGCRHASDDFRSRRAGPQARNAQPPIRACLDERALVKIAWVGRASLA
jgi:hypothetical protein